MARCRVLAHARDPAAAISLAAKYRTSDSRYAIPPHPARRYCGWHKLHKHRELGTVFTSHWL